MFLALSGFQNAASSKAPEAFKKQQGKQAK
jgi:hypothetical protein